MLSLAHFSHAMTLYDLTVGPGLTNPIGYGDSNPTFSWKIKSDAPDVRQNAYRIVVSRSEEGLLSAPDLWDSGIVSSDQSVFVGYQGSALRSRDRVYWAVKVWDQHGVASDWSPVAVVEMGLLSPEDWEADWIYNRNFSKDEASPIPYFRKSFETPKDIKSARLYVTARGIYEVYLNGQRIGNDSFSPGWTDYHKRIPVVTYDVTAYLHRGDNTLASVLGEGWYCGRLKWGNKRKFYGIHPEFLAQLEIEFSDGSRTSITTDGSWKTSRGPIRLSDLYDGETYDARLEMPGWNNNEFDDGNWDTVERKSHDTAIKLEPRRTEPVRKMLTLSPVGMHVTEPGSAIFDLGQNMVGWARIRVPGRTGEPITLRFAEMLQKDGSLYTENYRSAKSTDTLIPAKDGPIVWEPHFTFHGFRYVEISGLPRNSRPELSWIEGIVLHTSFEQTGNFSSSHPKINQLQSNIQWGQRGNFLEVPTDCPQRDERLGWTGDAQVFAPTACFNFDTLSFFSKWCVDLEDAQGSAGNYPFFAPRLDEADGVFSAAWGDAGIIIPWEVYQRFGYKQILEDNYESMKRFIGYYESVSDNFIGPDFGFGDWLDPYAGDNHFGRTSKRLIGTAYFAYCCSIMEKVAILLGYSDDAKRFEGLHQLVKSAFVETFVMNESQMTNQTQTAYLLALEFNLLPEHARPEAIQHLKALVLKRDKHLGTGFVGTPLINRVLSKWDEVDLAYEIALQETWPSWIYSINQGATTMWERWNSYSHSDGFGNAKMNSFNHYAYGAIGLWLYEIVAGLAPDPEHPGYKHFFVAPQPGGGLTHASARLETVYGLASSSWQIIDDSLLLEAEIPPNTSATVIAPSGAEYLCRSGFHRFSFPLSNRE